MAPDERFRRLRVERHGEMVSVSPSSGYATGGLAAPVNLRGGDERGDEAGPMRFYAKSDVANVVFEYRTLKKMEGRFR